MMYALRSGPLNPNLAWASLMNPIGQLKDVSPLLIKAIQMNETSDDDPPTIISDDGGHGIMQLTSSYPINWADPIANITYAVTEFIVPALNYWAKQEGYGGPPLVKLVAATYNAGLAAAAEAHAKGDVDTCTTNNYGKRAMENYNGLCA